MSAINEPIEVTIEKNGTLIILIDQHNLSAETVLDMATRAMLGAGYGKDQVVQAALAYAKQHAVSESTVATLNNDPVQNTVAPVAMEIEPLKISLNEIPDASIQVPTVLPELPTSAPEIAPPIIPAMPSLAQEIVSDEPAAAIDVVPAAAPLDNEAETPEIKEVVVGSDPNIPEATPPIIEAVAEETMPPPALESTTPAPEPAPVMEIAAITESPAAPEILSQARMDEVLAADKKRLQDLLASFNGAKSHSEPVTSNPANLGIPAWAVPAWPAPVLPTMEATPTSLNVSVSLQDENPFVELTTTPNDLLNQEIAPATDTFLSPPPLPAPLVAVNQEPPTPITVFASVEPAAVVPPVAIEADPALAENPIPVQTRPRAMVSRLTGFVKLETMAIPRYPIDGIPTAASPPKPVAPPVLSPPLSAPAHR